MNAFNGLASVVELKLGLCDRLENERMIALASVVKCALIDDVSLIFLAADKCLEEVAKAIIIGYFAGIFIRERKLAKSRVFKGCSLKGIELSEVCRGERLAIVEYEARKRINSCRNLDRGERRATCESGRRYG